MWEIIAPGDSTEIRKDEGKRFGRTLLHFQSYLSLNPRQPNVGRHTLHGGGKEQWALDIALGRPKTRLSFHLKPRRQHFPLIQDFCSSQPGFTAKDSRSEKQIWFPGYPTTKSTSVALNTGMPIVLGHSHRLQLLDCHYYQAELSIFTLCSPPSAERSPTGPINTPACGASPMPCQSLRPQALGW
jgi:hypothetical protein